MKTFDPWIYPIGVSLSHDACLQDKVEALIHENLWKQNNDSNIRIVSKKAFIQHLKSFGKKITKLNVATKAIAGHKLHSLQWISSCINQIITTLKSERQQNLTWRGDDEFTEMLFGNQTIKLKQWQMISHPCIESLLFQSIKTIADITNKNLGEEAINILSKRLYLLEKVRHNLRKAAPRHLQREQLA